MRNILTYTSTALSIALLHTSAFAGDTTGFGVVGGTEGATGGTTSTGTGSTGTTTTTTTTTTGENTTPPSSWGTSANNYGMEAPSKSTDTTASDYKFDWKSSGMTELTPSTYKAEEIKEVESVPDDKKMRQKELEAYDIDATTTAMNPIMAYTGSNTGVGEKISSQAALIKTDVKSDEKLVTDLTIVSEKDQIKNTAPIVTKGSTATATKVDFSKPSETVEIINKFNKR